MMTFLESDKISGNELLRTQLSNTISLFDDVESKRIELQKKNDAVIEKTIEHFFRDEILLWWDFCFP